ncbi:TPA: 3-hydroxyacyl-CoA dehydrogenase family protein, partial [Legionella pneumophila]|nr:3-hydroxybutyryl-CoA dehydrogenase [Legionella pneumophila]
MKQTKLTILGAGTMGSGIAQLFAQCGFYVTLIDNLQSQLDKAKATITKNLHYLALTQNLESTHSIETILASITFTTKLDELKQSEYIIENITENWERKKALYQVLKKECNATCILGVNTSSIPITKIASLVDHPQRVIGVHFMNPAPMMPMVEVIKGYHTDELTIEKTRT